MSTSISTPTPTATSTSTPIPSSSALPPAIPITTTQPTTSSQSQSQDLSQPQSQAQPNHAAIEPPVEGQVQHPLGGVNADIQGTGTEIETRKGEITPPVPMVHLRVLIISGDSHVFTFEPETTVGRMKELIWSMWPSSWTSPAQPPSPSFLRVLHAGRILSDDSTLASNNLPAVLGQASPTVIHISVRSFSIRAEEDPKKSSNLHAEGTRNGPDEQVSSGCRCVIM